MPIGTITMSDGRSGSVLRTDPTPSALVRPYDGGPAFADPHISTTRFSHKPTVAGQPHLQDKILIETAAEPPRSRSGTRSALPVSVLGAKRSSSMAVRTSTSAGRSGAPRSAASWECRPTSNPSPVASPAPTGSALTGCVPNCLSLVVSPCRCGACACHMRSAMTQPEP